MTVTVLVADDHGSVRTGLAMILGNAEGIEVVGEAADGATAISQARVLKPDVVLMDVRMPGTDGIEATKTIVGQQLAQVLVLTTFDLDEYVFGALRAGAAGFLLKSVDAARLIEAVTLVAAGEGVLAPQVTRRMLDAFAAVPERRTRDVAGMDELTERERDVLACLGKGQSNAEIAAELFIGETTVKTHVSRILAKLELKTRVQAGIVAREHFFMG